MSSWQIVKFRVECKEETSWTAADPCGRGYPREPRIGSRNSYLLHNYDTQLSWKKQGIALVEMQMEPQELRNYFLLLSWQIS